MKLCILLLSTLSSASVSTACVTLVGQFLTAGSARLDIALWDNGVQVCKTDQTWRVDDGMRTLHLDCIPNVSTSMTLDAGRPEDAASVVYAYGGNTFGFDARYEEGQSRPGHYIYFTRNYGC